MEHNPYKLKLVEKKPADYLNADELKDFLVKNKIPIKRMDNLPRFANQNNIEMKKLVREGSSGSVPTIYKIPNSTQIKNILDQLYLLLIIFTRL